MSHHGLSCSSVHHNNCGHEKISPDAIPGATIRPARMGPAGVGSGSWWTLCNVSGVSQKHSSLCIVVMSISLTAEFKFVPQEFPLIWQASGYVIALPLGPRSWVFPCPPSLLSSFLCFLVLLIKLSKNINWRLDNSLETPETRSTPSGWTGKWDSSLL